MLPKLNQRGSATVVALIFMVLLAALAAGFGSLVSSSIQVSRNEQAVARAQAAAESGLELIKSYLTQVSVSSATPDGDISTQVEIALQNMVHGYQDAGGRAFATTDIMADLDPNNKATCINFPIETAPWIQLHPNKFSGGFRATITPDPQPPQAPDVLIVAVTGIDAIRTDGQTPVRRQVYVSFPMKNAMGIFTNGVFSKGAIELSGGGSVTGDTSLASVRSMVTSGVSVKLDSASSSVAGSVYTVLGAGQVDKNANSVIGTGIQIPSSTPVIPDFNPTVFKYLATGTYTAGQTGTLTNVQIPPYSGTAKNPLVIDSGAVFQGVLYIGHDSVVIVKNATLNCAVVIEKDWSNQYRSSFTTASNVVLNGIPSDPALKTVADKLKGYAILAPTTDINVTANGVLNGSIIAYSAIISGGAGVNIVDGTIITLSDSTFSDHGNKGNPSCNLSGNGNFNFTRTADYVPPSAGIVGTLGSRFFVMDPRSYSELR